MSQSVPSVLLYAQALVLVQQMQESYDAGAIHSVEDIAEQLRDVLSRYEQNAGTPIMEFNSIVEGEPPLSEKMNRTWRNIQHDVNILQNQVDLLRASAIFTHNLVATEVMKSTNENARVANKLKTLQLYSNSVDSSVVTFGDHFESEEFVDLAFSTPEDRPTIASGMLHLGQSGGLVNLSEHAVVTILPGSNGFRGNNQEISDPATAPTDPISNQPLYTFIAETNPANDIDEIVDGEPNSWFEYEHYLVDEQDRLRAGNYNFTYQSVSLTGSSEVDWAEGPEDGKLKLSLQFDLGSMQKTNYLSYTPYGLHRNVNSPVLVRQVKTSPNGTDWDSVLPTDVWIGTDPNLQAARTADNVTTGNAIWSFNDRNVRYVRVDIEQYNPVSCAVGHLYYVDKRTGVRVKGPVPNINNPAAHYSPNFMSQGDTIQKREYFNGKRWAIGIRDMLIQQVNYQAYSTLVTPPLRVGGVVDRVTLEAEVYVPETFDSDEEWVSFYVTPDDGSTWLPISRVQDNYLDIPEIIAFNDPIPPAFREAGVAYYNTDSVVDTLRVKIELKRPANEPTSTPLVRSYQLKVRKR